MQTLETHSAIKCFYNGRRFPSKVPVSKSSDTTMKNLVPPVGTMVPIQPADVSLSKDDKTYMCRITFDDEIHRWVVASRFNTVTGRWIPTTKHKRLGFIVFFNDKPDSVDTHVKISAIQPSGQGAYGDSVKQPVVTD